MKYKNLDIVFAKNLTSINPLSQIIHMERITDTGMEMDFNLYSKLIKKFINSKEFLFKLNDQTLPLQVSEALSNIRNKDSFIRKDFDDMISILKYYNFDLFVVARVDINESEVELNNDYYWRTYAIDNFSDNPIGLSNYYTGYSIIGPETSYLYSINYLSVFGLSSAQLEEFDLENSMKSYEFMKSNGMLNDFDDRNSLEFLKSRGIEYKVLANII